MKTLRLALAQINAVVGDLEGNAQKILSYAARARDLGADLVAFPEMALTGYPPEDLLLKPLFIERNVQVLGELSGSVQGIAAVVGFVDRREDIYNAAAIISGGRVLDVYHKIYLPNYGVFDEMRYFQAGTRSPVYEVGGVLIGVNICEDIWYPEGPARLQALAGAEVVININSSPYTTRKMEFRDKMLATRATDSAAVVAYVNMVGGQDEIVFDGGSCIMNERGDVIARGRQFEEDLVVADLDIEAVFMHRLHDPRRRQQVRGLRPEDRIRIKAPEGVGGGRKEILQTVAPLMEPLEEVHSALITGLRDYVHKNGFEGGIIGLSGGVDSALVAALAADALGRENVHCLFMPSRYTSTESREDAYALVANLGVALTEIPIDAIFSAYLKELEEPFRGYPGNTTEENIQARIRGNLLMAFSNKTGWIVLTTGNKSEMSVGYATLYGDMAGGFAVVKDVPKTLVYDLAHWRNRMGEVIPRRILERPPSAELKPDQRDTDVLPAYDVLDPILRAYVEEERSVEEIVTFGSCEPECVKKVITMVDRSEYKRRQSPPGIKITPRAFGKDWRVPITNKYKSY
ncbi:MAG: NAD+ synthase [Nitrospirota bacterium]